MGTVIESGAPLRDVTTAQRQAGSGDSTARREVSTQFAKEEIGSFDEAIAQGYRTFVAAKQFENHKFLVVVGTNIVAAPHAGTPIGVQPIVRREGDVWARFTNGVLVTNEDKVISWCEEHPKMCRDAADPRTGPWATLKEMQTQTPSREVTLENSFDVDAAIFPDIPEEQEAFARAASAASESGDKKITEALSATQKQVSVDTQRASDRGRVEP